MADAAQKKLQDAVSGLVDDIDRSYMRKKQVHEPFVYFDKIIVYECQLISSLYLLFHRQKCIDALQSVVKTTTLPWNPFNLVFKNVQVN